MCLQCTSACIYLGKPLEGFILARSRRTDHGGEWPVGFWGLIQSNDPTFIWEATPDKETEAPHEFVTAFFCPVDTGYEIYKAAMKAGYNPETDGFFAYWLWDYLSDYLETAVPQIDEDPLPNAGEVDYTITNPKLKVNQNV